jgi:Na+-transporting methylmalonyl-CoA/oxaloacetate decarboxylase gamma subunit
MKRVLFVWVLCAMMSLGSFGVLLAEDLRLGLPLPYSMPLAFAAMLIAALILQLLAALVWSLTRVVAREAVRERAPAPASLVAEPPALATDQAAVSPPGRPRPPKTQGVVLFDMSRVARRGHAA